MVDNDTDFEFEQAISRQEDDRRRFLESQGLLRDHLGRSNILLGRGRSIVCRHWLRGMCWKGELCEFLHQYDSSRMPACRQFQKTGHCLEYERGNCVFLHDTNLNNKLEASAADKPLCLHYYLGFCRAGPKCRKRHQRLDKEHLPPLVPDWYLRLIVENASVVIPQGLDPETEAIMEHVEAACRDLAGAAANVNGGAKTMSSRQDSNNGSVALPSSSIHQDGGSDLSFDIERSAFIKHGKRPTLDGIIIARAQKEGIPRLPPCSSRELPRIRVFMIKSSELRNIYKSIRLGVWATGKQNTRLLEQAYLENDHVVLLFSANESGGFQGYARMATVPVASLYPNLWGAFSARLGANFRVQWLKQCKVEFEKVSGLTNPLNDDQPIRKSRDCQELPLSLAQIICTIMDSAPDENLLAGTEEANLPSIDHSNFFNLSEEQKKSVERSLNIPSDQPTTTHCFSNVSEAASPSRLPPFRGTPY